MNLRFTYDLQDKGQKRWKGLAWNPKHFKHFAIDQTKTANRMKFLTRKLGINQNARFDFQPFFHNNSGPNRKCKYAFES